MRLTILGCGTSSGVPLLHCRCKICRSTNPRNKRLRASVWIQTEGKSFLIDTSTDLRQQAFRARIPRIDAVFYTHPHADHLHGIDELRSFNYIQKSQIPIYGNQWTYSELKSRFEYIFKPMPVEGGAVPQLELNLIDAHVPSFSVQGVEVIPIPVMHGSKECVGYRFNSMAYVTDCSIIPPSSMERMKGLSHLVLDCLRVAPHRTHFNLEKALSTIELLKPKRTYLTHLGHDFDYNLHSKKLPKGVSLAYDGLIIKAL